MVFFHIGVENDARATQKVQIGSLKTSIELDDDLVKALDRAVSLIGEKSAQGIVKALAMDYRSSGHEAAFRRKISPILANPSSFTNSDAIPSTRRLFCLDPSPPPTRSAEELRRYVAEQEQAPASTSTLKEEPPAAPPGPRE